MSLLRRLVAVSLFLGCGVIGIAHASAISTGAKSSAEALDTAPATYVALGDSYSSGEGIPGPSPDPWLNTSGIPWSSKDGCDRSALAYPLLVAQDIEVTSSFQFRACSGAVTGSTYDASNFSKGSPSVLLGKKDFEASQLTSLSSATTTISLTVGGDDLGFAKVLAACAGVMVKEGPFSDVFASRAPGASSARCSSDLAQSRSIATSTSSSPPSLEGALVDTYTQILDAAPNAALFVLNYPQFFSTSSVARFCPLTGAIRVGPASLYLGISPSQLRDINDLELELNSDIATAVQQVDQALGPNRIVLVNDNLLTSANGLTCNTKTMSTSDINGVIFSLPGSISTFLGDCFLGKDDLVPHCSEALSAAKSNIIAKGSLHPKARGQALMATALESSIAELRALTNPL
ncbi:MAG: SGNH/GDSL hydrolase family protein [Acidimicrobiales bacterium]|jgi:hypothetical protein